MRVFLRLYIENKSISMIYFSLYLLLYTKNIPRYNNIIYNSVDAFWQENYAFNLNFKPVFVIQKGKNIFSVKSIHIIIFKPASPLKNCPFK